MTLTSLKNLDLLKKVTVPSSNNFFSVQTAHNNSTSTTFFCLFALFTLSRLKQLSLSIVT